MQSILLYLGLAIIVSHSITTVCSTELGFVTKESACACFLSDNGANSHNLQVHNIYYQSKILNLYMSS